MSGMLGAGTGPQASTMLQISSEQGWLPNFQWNGWSFQPLEPWRDGLLWPYSKMSGMDANSFIGLDSVSTTRWGVERGNDSAGGQQQKKLIGVTRDNTGAVLGSCVIQGIRTSDDAFDNQMTSDSAGYFEFCCKFTTAYYLVAYKAGSPDVAGTTVNTLIPV
jgi:hypothetical protein